jgi:hypothetical protein
MTAADLDGCNRRPVLLGNLVLADNATVVVAAIGPLDNVAIGPQGGRILFGPPQSAIQVTVGPVLVTVWMAGIVEAAWLVLSGRSMRLPPFSSPRIAGRGLSGQSGTI